MTRERLMEIIEQFKQNRVQYFMWTDEEKSVANNILRKWWFVIYKDTLEPLECNPNQTLGQSYYGREIYRLVSDYQPEPESPWNEYEVKVRNGGIYYFEPEGDSRCELAWGMSLVGFGGVKYEECKCGHLERSCGLGRFRTYPPHPCDDCGPHKPIKVRFWRQK